MTHAESEVSLVPFKTWVAWDDNLIKLTSSATESRAIADQWVAWDDKQINLGT